MIISHHAFKSWEFLSSKFLLCIKQCSVCEGWKNFQVCYIHSFQYEKTVLFHKNAVEEMQFHFHSDWCWNALCILLFLSSFLLFFFFSLSLHIHVYNLWFQVQFIILVSWNILDYQGTSRCHARRMTVFQNKLCSPLGSGIDEYMSVIKHRKHFWKVNPMLCLNVKEIMYSFWGV